MLANTAQTFESTVYFCAEPGATINPRPRSKSRVSAPALTVAGIGRPPLDNAAASYPPHRARRSAPHPGPTHRGPAAPSPVRRQTKYSCDLQPDYPATIDSPDGRHPPDRPPIYRQPKGRLRDQRVAPHRLKRLTRGIRRIFIISSHHPGLPRYSTRICADPSR